VATHASRWARVHLPASEAEGQPVPAAPSSARVHTAPWPGPISRDTAGLRRARDVDMGTAARHARMQAPYESLAAAFPARLFPLLQLAGVPQDLETSAPRLLRAAEPVLGKAEPLFQYVLKLK